MCNLSQGIYDDGIKKGKAEGLLEGEIINALKVVKNLLEKGYDVDEVCKIANIDKETYEEYSSKEQ